MLRLTLSLAGYSASSLDDTKPIDPTAPICPVFKELGERFGPVSLGLIPIGAYAPTDTLGGVHCTPRDAVRIFQDSVSGFYLISHSQFQHVHQCRRYAALPDPVVFHCPKLRPSVLGSIFPQTPSATDLDIPTKLAFPLKTSISLKTCISLEDFHLPCSREVSHHTRDQWAKNPPPYRAPR
jgi:hypothetical protein